MKMSHLIRGRLAAMWVCVVFALLNSPVPATASEPSAPPNYAFTNGRWFDGSGFQKAAWYSVQGRLTRTPPAEPVQIIDLAGAFVIPPFGEAHNHNIEGEWNLETVAARYLKDGVFYVKNPNDVRDFAVKIGGKLNLPHTIDVAFAHAGLTGSGGHPGALYEDVLRLHRYEPVMGRIERGWFENRAYVVVDNEQDLDKKWALITGGKPDFIKAYLVHSDDAATDNRHGKHNKRSGLNPVLLPNVVKKAHAAGLPVSVHVETAADFRSAVRSGADEIAHLPGWMIEKESDVERVRLSEEDARLAASQGVVVVTTTVASRMMPGTGGHHPGGHTHGTQEPTAHPDSYGDGGTLQTRARDVQRDNLRLLLRYGVKLAIGSDHADTSLAEVLNLNALGVFDSLTLLKLWCEVTPAAIFSHRKIGRFEEGYEASFLALEGDPLADITNVQTIRLRVKQGMRLDGLVE